MRTYLLLCLLVCLVACADPAPRPTPPPLPNGIYEVLAVEREPGALPTPNADTRVLPFDRRFIDGGLEMPPAYVLVRTAGYAPLDLAKPPTEGDANGRAVLLLNLKPEAGKRLEQLTTTAKRAAVVIGGDIVTVHGIKVPIEGGGIQVSC